MVIEANCVAIGQYWESFPALLQKFFRTKAMYFLLLFIFRIFVEYPKYFVLCKDVDDHKWS